MKKELKKETSHSTLEEKSKQQGGLTDPFIYPPKHYMMNEKMIDFYKKHDDFKKTISKENKK